ncbi:MAG: MBL fold metallo-hydrolase [Thermoleophilia bacterium]|nr:MBL fold metallo-hydrolase [Thermoleophilia bacterium]
MNAKFSLLGTGGWIPTPGRETTCAILSRPEALFIFDAGTGLSRLLEERFRPELEPGREVHLFLTHYHLDHVAGLVYLPAMFKGRKVSLHAPAAAITGVEPLQVISSIVSRPFNPQPLSDFPVDLSIEPLGEGEHLIAGTSVRVRKQIHPDPSVAYRVDGMLAFVTDTASDPGTVEFSRGVSLLVHEAWIDGIEEEDPATEQIAREAYTAHASARQCADMAAAAGVGELILCHLIPLRPASYHEQMLASARAIFPRTRILEDGEVIEI